MAFNVLIVDDSPMMRNLVGRILNLSGLDIGSRIDAGNGVEALKMMQENPVDLVFVDINMPVMNGEELVREMATKESLRDLPVVVISTDGTHSRMERMKDLGVFGYLQKPFRPEELRDEVERIIQMRRFSTQQICEALSDAASRVVETMCFSCVQEAVSKEFDPQSTPMGIVVRFSGSLYGSLQLWASPQLGISLAANFLGDEATADDGGRSMLNELTNMICGTTLTELYREGDFQLESPVPVSRAPEQHVRGQLINSDDGCMWILFEVGKADAEQKRNPSLDR